MPLKWTSIDCRVSGRCEWSIDGEREVFDLRKGGMSLDARGKKHGTSRSVHIMRQKMKQVTEFKLKITIEVLRVQDEHGNVEDVDQYPGSFLYDGQ